jgi:basic membrane protein A and related proteins
VATAVLAAIILATAAGCGKEADEGDSGSSGGGDGKRAALIIAQGGLGDGSYNDLANKGFKAGLEESGIAGRAIESNDVVAQAQPILERATRSGFGLVIDLEFSHLETLQKIAADNPDTRYGFLNAVVKGKNVTSIVFSEQEGSYLAGLLAALMTTQTENPKINPEKVIGVIGGTKSTGIDKFLVGYIQGAKAADKSVKVLTSYTNDFGDPSKGKQIADSMYDQGADIVYAVTGGSGAGVIEAAKERKHYAIGVDTDQDGEAPGFVLTSMIKRTDLAVAGLVIDFAEGNLKGGETVTLGLKDEGVGLSPFKYTKKEIPAEVLDRVDQARTDIIDGKIKVWNVIDQGYPSFYKP